MRYLRATAYPVPEVLGADGPDLVMERLHGRAMLADMAARPWRAWRHARTLAVLHDRLQDIPAPPGLRNALGRGERILHLDLHPGNVMLTAGGPVVIDWTNASAGPPGADVAMTYLIMDTADVDAAPRWLRPAIGLVRRALMRRFRKAVRDDPVPYLARVPSYRIQDINVRPAEARRLSRLHTRFRSADEVRSVTATSGLWRDTRRGTAMAATTMRAVACAGNWSRATGQARLPSPRETVCRFEFSARSFAEVIGPSGSGRSTRLHCLAGLDRPTPGPVRRMSRFNICTVPTDWSGRKTAATRRILVCTATFAALTAVGCGGPSRLAVPSHPPRCASQLFLGVRGSGEDPAQLLGMGTTVYAIFAGLRAADRRLAGYGWPYNAARPDTAELKRAAAALGRFLRERARQCPAERVVLAGYSDGAQIVGDAVQEVPSRVLTAERVTAAVLLADPEFNPADTPTAVGTFDPRYGGAPRRPAFPRSLASHVHSYCRRHDVVCQRHDPAASKGQHGNYQPQQTCQAITFIESAADLHRARC